MILTRSRAGRLLGATGLLCLLLAGCRTAADGGALVPPASVEPAPEPVAQRSATPPGPLAPPHLEGPTPTITAADTIAPPPTPTSVHTSTPDSARPPGANDTGDTPPTPTPTPMPTFTPPPPPPPLEGQQLWLQRPVPTSGPAWTDKTYPYGSTRGGALRPHTGVEFIVPTGTPVLAAASGTVIAAGDDNLMAYGPQTNFYGNLAIIEHDSNGGASIFTLYGHLSEVSVTVGQPVSAGEVIGLSGASGVADGPHLHFEVRVGTNSYGATRNPLLWLAPLPQTGVVAGRVVGPSGELLYQAPVALIRVDGAAPYTATTTYAPGEPNSDDALGENFALDDVVPGFYQVIAGDDSRRSVSEMWVFPGRVNFVEIVLGG